jgi:hypothetical protein
MGLELGHSPIQAFCMGIADVERTLVGNIGF